MRGHLWTILPHLRDGLVPPQATGVAWSTELEDPISGRVRLTGVLDEVPGADRLVVVIHGMGGNAGKGYVVRSARHARELGMSSLRLNLRGSDQQGQDIYHAGLVADLEAAVGSPELAHYKHLHAMGFSLGGHMVASYALKPDARMRSVAALCSPIDLDAACLHIDEPRQLFYRRHLLAGLRKSAERVRRAGTLQLTDAKLERIRKIRAWDDQIVAPRFGFQDAADYYRQVSVGSRLGQLAIPALFIFAGGDPMVAPAAIAPALSVASPRVTVRHVPGGHVHIPARTGALPGTLRWLKDHGEG